MKSWDDGVADLDPSAWNTNVADAFQVTFNEFPGKMALSFMGVEITFHELDVYSNQFANALIDHGFVKGDVVAVSMPNIPEYMIAYVGAMKAGCILSGVSPLLSEAQLEYQLNDLGTNGKKVCFVTLDKVFEARFSKVAGTVPMVKLVIWANVGNFLPKIKQVLGKLVKKIPTGKVTLLDGKEIVDFRDILKNSATSKPKVDIAPDDIAYIQYTGGTTGAPKGAMLSHRNVMADLIIVQNWLGLKRGRGLAVSGFPFFHIAGDRKSVV